ncbi:TadE/TadG family type IV pilus assembly protein [Agromyces sp. NDB4Y10]|uniref:TadE/TadG family type IV pilus assembly protein n=1 Tax=Agromyces sp. NDB4Y10 TaxID=1775951 RepID=UPI00082E3B99|nr:TadE/TadG family type IV pilus assembly protein [Agromyces sp. NDB4Y10]
MTTRGFAARLRDERGSAVAEFSLVGVLLTALVLAVVQLALALHVRNTVLDAAAEGARYAALAGSSPAAGVERTRALIGAAIAADYAGDVSATTTNVGGATAIAVTVRTTLPVVGLLGPERALEVTGHAPVETVD